jgi:glycosyl transferase family 87
MVSGMGASRRAPDHAPDHAGPVARIATRPLVIAALLAFHVVALIWTIRAVHLDVGGLDDAGRFQEIARAPGLPYRDFPVEYAPAETLLIQIIVGPTAKDTARTIAILAFAADLATFAILARAYGRRTAARYLALTIPVLPFIYLRFDPVPTALAVAAVAMAARGGERKGGLALGLAALMKIWPVVVAPIWLVRRRRCVATWFVGTVVAGGLAWIAVGGLGGPSQVATFRHAPGWHVGSLVGDVVWLATGGPVALQGGAVRVGTVEAWAPWALGIVAVAVIGWIWTLSARADVRPEGIPALAAVVALCVCSPLFSIQYLWWMLPWAAIGGDDRRGRTIALVTWVVAWFNLAAATALVYGGLHTTGTRAVQAQFFMLGRNLGCLLVLVLAVRALRRAPIRAGEGVPTPAGRP